MVTRVTEKDIEDVLFAMRDRPHDFHFQISVLEELKAARRALYAEADHSGFNMSDELNEYLSKYGINCEHDWEFIDDTEYIYCTKPNCHAAAKGAKDD